MESDTIIVELVVPEDPEELSLREDSWSLALDQQEFGPGRLLVATADRAGNLLAIRAHESARAAQGYVGYHDHAEGAALWRPP